VSSAEKGKEKVKNGGALPHAPKASDNYVFDRNTGILKTVLTTKKTKGIWTQTEIG